MRPLLLCLLLTGCVPVETSADDDTVPADALGEDADPGRDTHDASGECEACPECEAPEACPACAECLLCEACPEPEPVPEPERTVCDEAAEHLVYCDAEPEEYTGPCTRDWACRALCTLQTPCAAWNGDGFELNRWGRCTDACTTGEFTMVPLDEYGWPDPDAPTVCDEAQQWRNTCGALLDDEDRWPCRERFACQAICDLHTPCEFFAGTADEAVLADWSECYYTACTGAAGFDIVPAGTCDAE